jgi:hypothetical protein
MLDVEKMRRDLAQIMNRPRVAGWDAGARADIIAALIGKENDGETQTGRFLMWAMRYADSLPVHHEAPQRAKSPIIKRGGYIGDARLLNDMFGDADD